MWHNKAQWHDKGLPNERRTAPRRFLPPRESWDKSQMGTAKVDWSQKGGKEGWEWDGCPRRVTHTHRSVQSLAHEGRKKKIPFRSLSLSRMHAWRGKRANIRRINGQGEDGWWSCLCVQRTVLLREWAGEGRQTRWQSGLMGNFGHLCKGGGGRPKKGNLTVAMCFSLMRKEPEYLNRWN